MHVVQNELSLYQLTLQVTKQSLHNFAHYCIYIMMYPCFQGILPVVSFVVWYVLY